MGQHSEMASTSLLGTVGDRAWHIPVRAESRGGPGGKNWGGLGCAGGKMGLERLGGDPPRSRLTVSCLLLLAP